MKIQLLFFLFLLSFFSAKGQFSETIQSGRPGQAIGPFTVGKNVFQLQTGVTYNQLQPSQSNQSKVWLHNTVLRFGVFERFEINGLFNWQTEKQTSSTGSDRQSGISNTQIGGRFHLLQGQGAIPAIGIQGRLLLKAQSKAYQRQKLGANVVLVTTNQVTSWLSLNSNWSIEWSGNGDDPLDLYILNASFSITEKLGGFIEVYGELTSFTTNYDGGFAYLLSNNTQLDFSAGWQGQNSLENWFLDFGLSWRWHNRS